MNRPTISPEVLALAEAQAAQDRDLLAALRARDRKPARPVRPAINLAIRPKKRKKGKR